MSSGWAATTRARCQSSGRGAEGMARSLPAQRPRATLSAAAISGACSGSRAVATASRTGRRVGGTASSAAVPISATPVAVHQGRASPSSGGTSHSYSRGRTRCRTPEPPRTTASPAARQGTATAPTVISAVVSALDLAIAACVAFLAGGINSIAGGGSLILFPTLVALGLPTVDANVTNSVVQWPGYLGGVVGFREEYVGQRSRLIRFGAIAALGGLAGSVLLLTTPSEAFDVVVPVLVLLASLLLAVQPLLNRRLRRAEEV